MIDENKLKKELAELSLKCPFSVFDERFALYTECFEKAICLLKDQPKVNEWIPVEERLPEAYEFVLVCLPNRVITVALKSTDGTWYNIQCNEIWKPIAWMQLPEPYEKADWSDEELK